MYHILIAEDNPTICKGIAACVDTSMPVCVAAMVHDGEQAKKVITEAKIDILISDIRMPKCTGLELAAWVQDTHPDIPAIILTSYGDFDYARQAIKSGVIDYLLKPTDPDELNQAIRKAIAAISQQPSHEKNADPTRMLYDQMHGKELVESIPQDLLSSRFCVVSVKWSTFPQDMPNRWQSREWTLYNMPEPGFTNFLFEIHQPMDPETYDDMISSHIRSLAIRYHAKIKNAGIGKITSFDELNRSRKGAQDALFEGLFITPEFQFVLHTTAIPTPNMPHELTQDNSRFRYAFSIGNRDEVTGIISQNFRHFLQTSPCYTTCRTICNHYLSLAAALSSFPYDEETMKKYSTRSFYLGQPSLDSIESDLADLVIRKIPVSGMEKAGGQHLAFSVRDFINEHFDSQLSLQSLADLFRISPNYLATQYKEYTGKTVITEIADVRLKHATGLLESTNHSIPEIAASLGYQSTEYFFRVFKKKFDMTPGQYRALHSNEENQ